VQDPRERPQEQRAQADQQHARFKHVRSDFLTLLNLWRYVKRQQRELSSGAFRRMCRAEHLNYLRIREWQDLESQLRQAVKQLGLKVSPPVQDEEAVDEDGIHQALLAGLLSHVGLRDADRRDYLGARNTRFSIFPGSGLFKKQPALVMSAELVETSRLYARVNAAIEPEWAESLGAHLVKRSYSEPHWSRKRAAVMAYERVTLYGVPLVADRLVSYGTVDRPVARELFIRHALVYGEWQTQHRFFRENRALLEEVEELEHRARRRDIVVDEHTLFDFYDARVGEDVVSGMHFDSWWKRARQKKPALLTFDPEMLVNDVAREVTAQDYPDTWQEDGLELPLTYHFSPGAADDGLTVDVPLASLNQVPDEVLSWQVPGLREDLVISLLRSLPKPLRVNFVPAPNHAKEFLAAVPAGREPLLDALERHLRSRTGVVVPREAWDWGKVPDHLRPIYRVLSEDGAVVATGKELPALKKPLAGRFADALTDAAAEQTRTGQTTWTFDSIERSFEQMRAGHLVKGFPALVDERTSVGLQVYGAEATQEAAHRLGVRRLLALTLPSPAGRLTEGWDNRRKLALAGSPYPSVAELLEDGVLAALELLMDRHGGPAWDERSFEELRATVRPGLEQAAKDVLADAVRALEGWRETDRALSGSVDLVLLPAMTDMRAQVGRLMGRGFVADVGAEQLRQLPRYLAAVRSRQEKVTGALHRDRMLMDQVAPLQEAYLHRVSALPEGQPEPMSLRRVRWLLEEYRVSLWAQQLGTPVPVSDTRIRKALANA
jgi:ATP-dependent helicase HrpA